MNLVHGIYCLSDGLIDIGMVREQLWVLTEERKKTIVVDNSPTTEGVLIKHIRTSVQGYHNIKSDNIKDIADRKSLEPVSGVLM